MIAKSEQIIRIFETMFRKVSDDRLGTAFPTARASWSGGQMAGAGGEKGHFVGSNDPEDHLEKSSKIKLIHQDRSGGSWGIDSKKLHPDFFPLKKILV